MSFIIARHVPIPRRSQGRSHTPEGIKGHPLQRREDQLPPGLLTKLLAKLCSRKVSQTISPNINARIADDSTEGVRLTVLAGYTLDPYPISLRDAQWDVGPQYEAHQSAGVGTPVPPHFLGYQDAVALPWFQPGHPGPYGHLHGLSTQPYPLQLGTYSLYTMPQVYNGLPLGVGGEINQSFAAGHNTVPTHGCAVPGYEDPGSFPRCDTNPGGPIHLTTNISVVSSQVSPLYLSQEVCRYSVWKTHWY